MAKKVDIWAKNGIGHIKIEITNEPNIFERLAERDTIPDKVTIRINKDLLREYDEYIEKKRDRR